MPSPSCLIYGACDAAQPFISVAIPTYKRSGLLCEALSSVLSQPSSLPYEIILVDNDQSPRILDLVRNFPADRLAVYQNSSNLGMWGNMNQALTLSRGEWVLFLPDDDLLVPGALAAFERVLGFCSDGEIGCLVGGVELLSDGVARPLLDLRRFDTRYPIAFTAPPGANRKVVPVTKEMPLADVPKLCSSFFRRADLVRVGGWDAECEGFADVAAYLRFQRDGKLFACNKVFGCFRVHDGNLSRPEKLWESYPLTSAHRLLADYVEEGTQTGKSIRAMLEKTYTSALWKRPMREEMRRKRAEDLLRFVVKDPCRRFLLRNGWLLSLLGRIYTTTRPALGRVLQMILRGLRKQSKNMPPSERSAELSRAVGVGSKLG